MCVSYIEPKSVLCIVCYIHARNIFNVRTIRIVYFTTDERNEQKKNPLHNKIRKYCEPCINCVQATRK